jgi:superoxide dismutase, Cu-Zn family
MNWGIKGTLVAALIAASFTTGCQTDEGRKEAGKRHAVAEMKSAPGKNVSGTVHFYEVKNGVRVVGTISGLTPGLHGFHIHETGECTLPDFKSAGGHFNPAGTPHGGLRDAHRHAGDMGNIEANASGVAKFDLINPHVSFAGPNSILGRALVVHEKADDLKSQPAGDAGGRIGCGIIRSR